MEGYLDLFVNYGFLPVVVIVLGAFVYRIWKQSEAREKKYIELLQAAQATNEKCVETLAGVNARLEVIEQKVLLNE